MRRFFLFIVLALIVGMSGLSAQTPANLHLKGKVVDSTDAAFPSATVKVYRGSAAPRAGAPAVAPVKEGVTTGVGDFDLELPAGEYRVEVSAPDFNTSSSAVRLTADMQPLLVKLTVKEFETIVEVNSNNNEVGVDPESSLSTDLITGDDLLDLPENPEDLLEYLTQLAARTGIVDGELNIRLDGLTISGTELPSRGEIQEIRIVNNSFSADSNSSGPRIEIVTKPGTGNWTGQFGLTFADESFNAAAPLTGRKPASQSRGFTGQMRGPIIPGRITATFNVSTSQSESESSALRAVYINGPVNEGVSRETHNRSINFSPTITLNAKNSVNGRFQYSDNNSANGGIGGLALPERATDSRGHNWSMNFQERMTISNSMLNTIKFQVSQNNSSNVPVTIGRAINVTEAFQAGGAPNRSQNSSQNIVFGNEFRWQKTRALTLTGSFDVNYHKTNNKSENNYLGTYTFSSLHDYCYAEARNNGGVYNGSECLKTQAIILATPAGQQPYFTSINPTTKAERQIAITGTPTQFTMTSGVPGLLVTQSEFAAFLQADWRITPRAQLQIGARYQMQQHLNDYNNIAPTAGLNYTLFQKAPYQTVLRVGARMQHQQFAMNGWEQLLRGNGVSSQTNILLQNPSYPNPDISLATQTAVASSLRLRDEDYAAPYSVRPSIQVDQSLPKGHRISVSYQVDRGYRQSRTRNINAPYPGTAFDEDFILQLNSQNSITRNAARALVNQMRPYFPMTSTINMQESVGGSVQKNLNISWQVQNKRILWNRVQISGRVGWAMAWAQDDAGNILNPYDLDAEWGRSTSDQRHRITSSLNVQVPWNMRFTINPSWSSGRPYSITSGRDENGDSSSNDRAKGYAKNSETGPSNFGTLQLGFSKIFQIGGVRRPTAYAEPQRGGGGGGGGFGGGGGGGQRGGTTGGRQITFSMTVRNLFNSTTRSGINGNLSSPLFGQLTSGGQGRSINFSLNTNLGRLF
jgi:hypothetical protein